MTSKICGVDEAGRGPVMGPLVVSGVSIEDESVLSGLGVKDSKRLTPKRREELAVTIKKLGEIETVQVPAEEIDNLREEMTLNELEVRLFVSVLDRLRPDVAYVDSVDVNADRFRDDIKRGLDFDIEIVSRHQADDIYPVVSAASIIAKTTRDNEIKKIEEEIGQDIGSGYPSDPITIGFLEKWIRENHDLPPHTRKSWETSRKILQRVRMKKLNEFER
ncbi:MAG: ribonuclease HII [Thermoplasmata archaeon]|nr:ribonuclease HII [Thermoplasmata archaeon]